jgi:hypothetical protein
LDTSGRRLSYSFTGSPLHYSNYRVRDVVQTDHALCVTLEHSWKEPRPDVIGMSAAGRTVDVELDRPLGARVLIDHQGHPLPVVTRHQ